MTTNTEGVVRAADALLAQCAEFIDGASCEAFCRESDRIKGGTLGKHARHVVDHFAAIVDGLQSGGLIDYDHRERDESIETKRAAALDRIAGVREAIGSLGDNVAMDVRVRVMLSGDGEEAELESNVARELFFATHHAIHHHAMMKSIADECGVSCGCEFGTAPSTINFQRAGS